MPPRSSAIGYRGRPPSQPVQKLRGAASRTRSARPRAASAPRARFALRLQRASQLGVVDGARTVGVEGLKEPPHLVDARGEAERRHRARKLAARDGACGA
eukprot:6388191-Prymnesium_polylepis.1